MLAINPKECNSTLMSGTSLGAALTYTVYTRVGGQLDNKCNSVLKSAMRGETLIPNPNKCNSTLVSGTSGRAPSIQYILRL